MKYKLFCGESYYPNGGYDDFNGNFETIEDAKNAALEICKDMSNCWAHIVCDDEIIETGCRDHYLECDKWQWMKPVWENPNLKIEEDLSET